MRVYRVPADVTEKEKIIGGLLTAEQGVWLGGGFFVGVGMTLILSKVMPALLAIIFSFGVGLGIAVPFAFVKKRGLTLMSYFRCKRVFNKQTKFLINDLAYHKKF